MKFSKKRLPLKYVKMTYINDSGIKSDSLTSFPSSSQVQLSRQRNIWNNKFLSDSIKGANVPECDSIGFLLVSGKSK